MPLTDEQVQNIIVVAREDGDEGLVTEELVREIEASFAEHGAWGGGNQHGMLGTYVAHQIEKQQLRKALH